MKEIVVVITLTLKDEHSKCEEIEEFLQTIKDGSMREEMMSDIFEEIKIKYEIYKKKGRNEPPKKELPI